MQQKIPIENLYYLLCYAWGVSDQLDKVKVDGEETDEDRGNWWGYQNQVAKDFGKISSYWGDSGYRRFAGAASSA